MLSGVFFFFQAEDGIRDGRVTGVQTCALPISECPRCGVVRGTIAPGPTGFNRARMGVVSRAAGLSADRGGSPARSRSEERRVGKGVDLGGRRSTKKKDEREMTGEGSVGCGDEL